MCQEKEDVTSVSVSSFRLTVRIDRIYIQHSHLKELEQKEDGLCPSTGNTRLEWNQFRGDKSMSDQLLSPFSFR